MHLLELPGVMLEHIFSFLPYDTIAKNRIVCKGFDAVSQRVLNRGFQVTEKLLTSNLKAIKSQLPRRESERRFHPLAKHCEILTSVETRFSMISMAYARYIEEGKCCFIPGKILDELRHVMHIVNKADPLPVAFEVLQELRDISCMAIEHFDDVVAPTLRQRTDDYSQRMVPMLLPGRGDIEKKAKSTPGTSIEMALLREACLKNNKNILKIEKKYYALTRKLELYKRLMTLSKRQMIQRQIEQSYRIAELKRKIDEYEVKFNELLLTRNTGFKSCLKGTRVGPYRSVLRTAQRLRNSSSQIQLDASSVQIGPNRGGRGSPIIKPRRASLNRPLKMFSDDIELDSTDSIQQSESESVKRLKLLLKDQIQKPAKKKLIVKANYDTENYSTTRDRSPVPSTSREMYADVSEGEQNIDEFTDDVEENFLHSLKDTIHKGKKRLYSEQFGQTSVSDGDESNSAKGFQTKVQLLSRTLMKLIESITDNSNTKRRRLNGGN